MIPLAKIYATLGMSFSLEGLPDVAIKYLEDSLRFSQNAKDISQEIMSNMLIARMYNRQVLLMKLLSKF
jgi:hypothetical protein